MVSTHWLKARAPGKRQIKDEAPVDTILGVEIFPVVHVKSQEEIYVSLEDIEDV